MTIRSMTGFGRSDGHDERYAWHWEMRCVNGRGLDVRTRLPQGYEGLEIPVREACKKRLARGNCSATLTISRESSETGLRLNEDVLKQLLKISEQASAIANAPMPGLEALLSMRGVIEVVEDEETDDARSARLDAILTDFNVVLDAVNATREEEGKRLSLELANLLKDISGHVAAIENSPSRTADSVAQRLRQQLDRLFADAPSHLDDQRVFQEAAMLAAKADIEEEIVRLKAHIDAAGDLLSSDEPVGRKFDFLSQEFNREANTICSKSNDTDITQAGLALKAAIDRMREQVQNIE